MINRIFSRQQVPIAVDITFACLPFRQQFFQAAFNRIYAIAVHPSDY
jgi:hypothetical protein